MTQWFERVGQQRDWLWRGWQIRYSVKRAAATDVAATPIVLLHGFGAALEHWRHNLPTLAEGHTVYAVDLLGFGGSRKVKTTYSTRLWAEQLYEWWRSLIGVPVILIGNSLGSLVCTVLAHSYPEMVSGLVLLNLPDVSLRQAAMPSWLASGVYQLENALSGPWLIKPLLKLLRRPAVLRSWIKIAYPRSAAVTLELVELISRPAYDEGSGDTLWALSRSLRRSGFSPAMTEVIAQLRIPILLIWGERDRMVPFQLAQRFTNLNPQLTFISMPQAGHCPHDEYPDEFHEILLPWLDCFRTHTQ
ncbi:MAG: alpha/beta fold hydrolase [Cyanobacteria bacterium P01_G01_bin.54]